MCSMPGAGQLALHRPARRGDIGGPAGGGERRGDLDRAALDPAGDQARDHLKYRRRRGLLDAGVRDVIVACHVAAVALFHANARNRLGAQRRRRESSTPARGDNRLPQACRRGAGDCLSGRLPLRHDRHQGVVSARLLPAARPRLRALRLFRARRNRAAISPTARSARWRDDSLAVIEFADRGAADPGRVEHGRLDHGAGGLGAARAHRRPGRHRRRARLQRPI